MINYKDKIVEVTWLDASGKIAEDREIIDNINPSELLVVTKTYGKFAKEDEKAILLLMEDSPLTVDYCAIPKQWILPKGIRILK